MRVVFLGSPPFATPILAALLESSHELVGVVTPPERGSGRRRAAAASPVAELAEAAEVVLLRPDTARDPEFQARLTALEPEAMMVASYGEILDDAFLAIAPAFNVHASLLPRHRGASPIQAAILAGDEVTGVSVQRIVQALDAGDVVLSIETAIGPEETAAELFPRLSELGARAAVEALDRVAAGTAVYTPQDPDAVTVCRKLKKEHGRLDWSRSAVELERHVRAMNSWPMARTTLPGGRSLQVLRARVADTPGRGIPGTVLEADRRLVVAAGPGGTDALECLELRTEGKSAQPAEAWLRGARLEPGVVLGGLTGGAS